MKRLHHCMALNFEIVIDQSALLHIHVIDCIYRYAPFSHPNWVWSSYWAVAGNSVCAATDTGSSCTDLSPLSIRRWSMLVCGFNLGRSVVIRRSTCTWLLWRGLLLFGSVHPTIWISSTPNSVSGFRDAFVALFHVVECICICLKHWVYS